MVNALDETQYSTGVQDVPGPDTYGRVDITPVTGFGSAGLKAEWQRYCGFLDLSVEEFMEVQSQLLMEQIRLMQDTPLGRKLFKGRAPASVEEFRSAIGLTTYGNYLPFLGDGQDSSLGDEPHIWAHTTGAQADFKWVPYTAKSLERTLDSLMGAFILAAADKRGDVNVRPGDTVLYNTPARPYVSGLVTFGMRERFGFRGVLDPETSEHMEFRERIQEGFEQALGKRVDIIVSMTSVLSRFSQSFADRSRGAVFNRAMLKPRAFPKLLRAWIKRTILRQTLLPKDLWPTKAILGWGIDTGFFRDKVEAYWGQQPFEIYGCTEGGIMGTGTWERGGLVLTPYSNFFEFIPLEESIRSREDTRFVPRTVQIDEVRPGQTYELVITNFHGMAFFRYRVGHYVQFLSEEESSPTFAVPQMRFLGRTDDRIDLAGFTRLDAKTIWEALNLSEIEYREWTATKDFEAEAPVLHLYLETKEQWPMEVVRWKIHEAIKSVDPFYADLEEMLGISPLRVTLLSPGTFDRFYDHRQAQGYELESRTPAKMNPTDDDLRVLVALGST